MTLESAAFSFKLLSIPFLAFIFFSFLADLNARAYSPTDHVNVSVS